MLVAVWSWAVMVKTRLVAVGQILQPVQENALTGYKFGQPKGGYRIRSTGERKFGLVTRWKRGWACWNGTQQTVVETAKTGAFRVMCKMTIFRDRNHTTWTYWCACLNLVISVSITTNRDMRCARQELRCCKNSHGLGSKAAGSRTYRFDCMRAKSSWPVCHKSNYCQSTRQSQERDSSKNNFWACKLVEVHRSRQTN